MSYSAPVDRISFSLKHEAGFDRLYDAIPELDADLICCEDDSLVYITESKQ